VSLTLYRCESAPQCMSPSVVSPEEIHLDLTPWTLFSFLPAVSVLIQYSMTSSVFQGTVFSSAALNHAKMSTMA
jgi:hypothetical protein